VLFVSIAFAGDSPNAAMDSKQVGKVTPEQARQKLFYGYVPPAPILHTWPGGYRVILHDMTNSFIDHFLGRY